MILQIINTILLAGIVGMLIMGLRKPAIQPANHEVIVTTVEHAADERPHLLNKPQGDSWQIYDIRLLQSGKAKVIWIRTI